MASCSGVTKVRRALKKAKAGKKRKNKDKRKGSTIKLIPLIKE